MSISDKLKDPELSPDAEAEIIGAFVRRQKREALGERWTKKLSSEHNVKRSHLRGAGKPTPRLRRLRWILPAVAAALLLLVLLLPQLQGGVQSRTEVAAAILEETKVDVMRGETTGDYASLQTTFKQQYNGGDFAAAIATGKQLVADPAAQPQDRLYLGLAYLNADELTSATTTFEELLVDTSGLRTEATFYLALTLLERDQEAAAVALLEGIESDDGAAWYRKAQKILAAD